MVSETKHRRGGESNDASSESVFTLRDVALAYLGRLMFSDEKVEPLGAEQAYLFHHYQPMRRIADLSKALHRCLQRPADVDAQLAKIVRILQLGDVEVVALIFALLVEEEPMVGRVLAHVQAPVGGSRPALGMLEAALAPVQQQRWITGDLLAGPALASGLLQLLNEQAPYPEQMVKVPLGLALLLRGHSFFWPGTRPVTGANLKMMDRSSRLGADPARSGVYTEVNEHRSRVRNNAWATETHIEIGSTEETVRLPLSTLETADRQARALGRSAHGVLVIRSASQRESRAVAAEVAAQLGHEALLISPGATDLKGLGVACLLGERLPVFEYGLSGDEQVTVPELAAYSGPRLVLAGPDGQIAVGRGSVLQWSLTPPSRHERHQLWNEYLNEPALAEQLAREHIHSTGRIAELAQLAQREAQLYQRDKPRIDDIRRAAWEAEAGLIGNLAQPIKAEIPDEALVLSKTVTEELEQLLARCRCRENLDAELGVTIKARYQQGVRSLLVGPSGTGKTLVASWLATKLGLPLYRVDLASVVSKYIGETEKNLATLLARAEHSEIVLLFDEADSLFGKRTDIKDSNDRFANSQTNYLLQRIEFYRGIVLLTSNSRDRFDSAFTRRLDKVIEFPMPTPQERRALWYSHLGGHHQLSVKQINQLAVGSDLAGGHIRNAVLTAAVEARDAGRSIAFNDVVVGLAGEYRKQGRQFPAELRRYERPLPGNEG